MTAAGAQSCDHGLPARQVPSPKSHLLGVVMNVRRRLTKESAIAGMAPVAAYEAAGMVKRDNRLYEVERGA